MGDGDQGKVLNDEEDFVWRFSLGRPPSACHYEDPLVEMVRAFFADFLNMGFLTRGGERVQVDGFTFTKEPETVYNIFPDE